MKEKRVLIINRGEIAIRIAKAVRELGHVAIGLWTDNEAEPPHLEFCHEWVHLPGKSNSETYLNIPMILKIAKDEKVDAIHPGYGFLAENADFARALQKEKILFIGPHPEAIIQMGDKATSKKIAKDAGVPVVPGSVGEVPNVKEALRIAKEIGYPVLLKAVAGGGGKGMRVCQNDQDVQNNFESVKREAKSSFGYEGLLVEKFIVNPHHIEVQILADKKGNVYHVFERECSIQRRHQKIVEEAPSPFIGEDERLRQDICETAIKLAQAVQYDSAGTVEFIMGEDRSFYFLEMNTRIQVEHPISEEITGIDLLSNMILSAFEEPLDIKSQSDIQKMGHAIECRICAEDPITLLPSPGMTTGLEMTFPQGVRFDHCLFPGYQVTPDFDPMVGKLIVRGNTRNVAIRKMKNALEGLEIQGLKTNIPVLKKIIEKKNFIEGNYSTHFMEKEKPQDKVELEAKPLRFMNHAIIKEYELLGC